MRGSEVLLFSKKIIFAQFQIKKIMHWKTPNQTFQNLILHRRGGKGGGKFV
jgi:hypothetical protein